MRELKVFVLAAFFISILIPVLIYSQEKNTEYDPLAENKWSMTLEAGTFLSGTGGNYYKSFILSGKYHFNKLNGIRLSLATDGGTNAYNYNDGYPYHNATGYNEGMNLESDLHWIHYLKTDSKIKVYVGIGPYFCFSHVSNSTNQYTGYTDFSIDENEYSIGLSGTFGAEYFILDNISIVGEYYLNGYYRERVRSGYSNYLNYRDFSHGWAYNISRMRLGISVYF